jgi:WD40 repeat protein
MPGVRYSVIRHLYAPYDGPRVVGAEFEVTVYVWDLAARRRVSTFATALDYGGYRLAINPRGDLCAVASYNLGGLACYAADTGEVVCIRDDLEKLQRVAYSPDGSRLYCGAERGPLVVLDAETGADIDRYRAADKAFCSPFEPVELLSKRGKSPLELRVVGGKRLATLERTTFAILDVAFGPDRLCMTESGGPVRCLGTENGDELWRYTPRAGRHVLRLGYAVTAAAFIGVEWPYAKGGVKRLLRFDPGSGRATLVATVEKPCAKEVFCSRGSALLTTEGELIDVVTGAAKRAFRFPAARDGD